MMPEVEAPDAKY